MNYKTPKLIKAKNGSMIIDFAIDDPIADVVNRVTKTIRQNPKFKVYGYFPGTELHFRMFCFAPSKTLAIHAIAAHFKQKDPNEIRPFVKLEV